MQLAPDSTISDQSSLQDMPVPSFFPMQRDHPAYSSYCTRPNDTTTPAHSDQLLHATQFQLSSLMDTSRPPSPSPSHAPNIQLAFPTHPFFLPAWLFYHGLISFPCKFNTHQLFHHAPAVACKHATRLHSPSPHIRPCKRPMMATAARPYSPKFQPMFGQIYTLNHGYKMGRKWS